MATQLIIQNIIDTLSANGEFLTYIILFGIMCFEGPTIVTVAAFASSQGYLNPWIILLLGIFGGIIPDLLLYTLGRSLRVDSIERIVHVFGLNKRRIEWLEEKLKKHAIKSVMIIKLVPPLPIPGLILTGFMKVDLKKFLFAQIMLNTIGTLVFFVIGFYSGILTGKVADYLKIGEIIIPAIIICIIIVYFVSKYMNRKLLKILKEK